MTKTEWGELSLKQQWDILVAMRGPDCHPSEGIKWFTTSVIRGQMKDVMRVGGTVNDNLRLVVVPSGWRIPTPAKMEPFVMFHSQHFFQHVCEAASHIGIPTLQVKSELYRSALEAQIPAVIKAFLAYAIEHKGTKDPNGYAAEALQSHLDWLDWTQAKGVYFL